MIYIPRFTNDCSLGPCETEFSTADQSTIEGYIAGDWDGIEGTLAYYHSDTPGTKAIIIGPAGTLKVSYTMWKDVYNQSPEVIDATDGTNIDLGNNLRIDFGVKPFPGHRKRSGYGLPLFLNKKHQFVYTYKKVRLFR